MGYVLEYADIVWRDPATPVSSRYEDIYWSGGLDEKRHVFVAGSNLAERIAGQSPGANLTVAEIGFGFGLNFLLTVLSWRNNSPRKGNRLHYIAIEKHPVDAATLARLYPRLFETHPEMTQAGEHLLAQYPLPTPGMHTFWVGDDIRLTLSFADVVEGLANLGTIPDVWYLDGFSPARNADIWNTVVYRALAKNSRPGTRLATYSTAGHVRRGLAEAGFNVQKAGGFGQKAEMLTATLAGDARAAPGQPAGDVAIIGAGLSGLFCAGALVRRGVSVTIFCDEEPLTGASGVPQMAVYPQLALQPGHWNHFSLAAFQYLCRDEPGFTASGLNLLADSPHQQDRLSRLAAEFPDDFLKYADPGEISAASGLMLDKPGAMFRTAGWLDPARAFSDLMNLTGVRGGVRISDLQHIDGKWQLLDDEGTVAIRADTVIIATGDASFPAMVPLPVSPVRGQAVRLAIPGNQRPESIIAGSVTLFPPKDGLCTLSGTYEPESADLSVRRRDTNELVGKLKVLMPELLFEVNQAQTGLRHVARDRIPVVGPVPDRDALDHWHRQRHPKGAAFMDYRPGLYVCAAFGSHGATHAKLSAEYLASVICKEPLPLPRAWIEMLSPDRFVAQVPQAARLNAPSSRKRRG